MNWRKTLPALLATAVVTVGATGCSEVSDPGTSDQQVLYRWDDEPNEPTSAERGVIELSEVMWAGSVDDDGNYDPDDVFIEIRNRHHRPVNMTDWQIHVEGDYEYSFTIPPMEERLQPNEYYVLAAKDDGAFADVADAIVPELKLGKRAVKLELRDADRRLIAPAGSEEERPFAGGYDLVTVRSMERTQALFDNQGGMDRSWTANVDDVNNTPEGRENISEGWRQNTLASPGAPNSADYSGSSSGGGFE